MNHTPVRLRRLRQNEHLRSLVRETDLSLDQLVMPLFIKYGDRSYPINSMPGLMQICLADLSQEIKELHNLGVNKVLLFGVPEFKDEKGSDSYNPQGIIQRAIQLIKEVCPSMLVITDVCFCEYMVHGHCGVVIKRGECYDIDNDATLPLIADQALSHAQAGADVVAPSGMMDGMVKAIREKLDGHGYHNLPIISYSVKYASSLYCPFREAAEGAPKFGNRRTYQMDYGNGAEALREAEHDLLEGADILMVKPATFYMDVIYRLKQAFPQVPLCAYQVSGEYSMIKAASQLGWMDEKPTILEALTGIRRAGANFIISYFTKQAAHWLK